MRYVLGLNQYSHDAGACLLSLDGCRSVVIPNERITRVKHDGGNTALAVQRALDVVGASLNDVAAVCANNHHNRVLPFEDRLPWTTALRLYPDSSLSEYNLLPALQKQELSHHLAHAWSVLAQAPFDSGLIVVMDGMGETLGAMEQSLARGEDRYMHDLLLDPSPCAYDLSTPSMGDGRAYREAESVYAFRGDCVRRVFKRWVPHRSPPELYNHGFENLESIGALYSRVSSHIFGDWNACGKVMGLGPWASEWASDAERAAIPSLLAGGSLDGFGAGALAFDWRAIESLPHPNGGSELLRTAAAAREATGGKRGGVDERLGFYAALSARVQSHLEAETLAFLKRLRQRTGEKNLCLVGGVIQNSVLNGRIAREAGFENVFIPAWPGDEGIPVGCAAYAQRVLAPQGGAGAAPRSRVMSAYQGRAYSEEEVASAIEEFAPWLEEVIIPDGPSQSGKGSGEVEGSGSGRATANAENEEGGVGGDHGGGSLVEGGAPKTSIAPAVLEYAARALAKGEVIAWCHGRAEVGARALGHRSILANPTRGDMHRRVNIIKQREQYRPLAPSALADKASEWFDGVPQEGSPFMQITASVKEAAREKVPAITHVDGSARLQTVDEADAPLYYALIAAFCALVGVPMVMNTSFNLAGMPIVESPADAIACFLDADPDLSMLVLFGRVFRRRGFPADPVHGVDAIPTPQRSFISRTMSTPSGEPLRVEVLVEDVWIELADALELEVLERCSVDGERSTARQLTADLVADTDGEVTEVDVVERLRHLHQIRLISMDI